MKWIKKLVFKILSGSKERMTLREFADRMVHIGSMSLWGEPFPGLLSIKNQETGDAITDEIRIELNAFRYWLLSMMIHITFELEADVGRMTCNCEGIVDEFRERWITRHVGPEPSDIEEGDAYDLGLTVPLSREKFTQILQDRITAYDKAFIEERGYGFRESWPRPLFPPHLPSYQVLKELFQNLGMGDDPKGMLMVAARVDETMKYYEKVLEEILKQYEVSDWKVEDLTWF